MLFKRASEVMWVFIAVSLCMKYLYAQDHGASHNSAELHKLQIHHNVRRVQNIQ